MVLDSSNTAGLGTHLNLIGGIGQAERIRVPDKVWFLG
jgi:hypothetical protein